MKVKDYGIPVCRILNIWQIILYKTNGLNEIETYVSKNGTVEYKIVYVFDREKSQGLFNKFRDHRLEVGDNLLELENL
ncbi:hypothetical protein [Faecalicatena contorta]|uniref:Uncharacterized protein n=1 Tax=Faecalicatena contorta TaxID=39482 RepID=A0A316AM63_9FIRM|nr:hypothetical protein [Faecalicatena contorta]PWJ51107.1 hypothetical protein A8805_103408 [Faecalicatena contorta]SUQ13675.1 hypothetical protein SAMN05216529_103408 [Faecalicatena contorta]